MADDIVTRLREHTPAMCGACDTWGQCGYGEPCDCRCHMNFCQEAADEIERLRKENAEYERICRKWKAPDGYQIGEMERIALATQNDNLRTNMRYYQNLVKELIPFMLFDVKCGLDLGPASKDHLEFEASQQQGPCSECVWYNTSLEWKKRIDSGEFGDIQLPE